MSRPLHKLTDRQCEQRRDKRGRLADGGGLYLSHSASGAKSWVFVWQRGGRFREMGLGSYPTVTLKRARELAQGVRQILADGGDPIAARKEDAAKAVTFGEMADTFLDAMESGWDNPKHRAQWRMTLGDAYCKTLRSRAIAEITTEDVLQVLRPIWSKKPETASRIRGRIERVLDHAKAKGMRGGENPARWRGHLDHILPPRKKLSRGHHAAMPYPEVPGFMRELQNAPGLASAALEFTILTACRTSEALGARWREFDLKIGVWTIPAERMKARRPHRVPLPVRAAEILRSIKDLEIDGDWVFPSTVKTQGGISKPLSNMAMAAVLKRMELGKITVHGFRSAFRDWAAEETDFPREVAEAALAHTVGDATERAYRRGDALEKRRALMSAWSQYLAAPGTASTVETQDVELM